MNRDTLLAKVAEELGLSKKLVDDVSRVLINAIGDALSDNESVMLVGFGTFAVADRPEREGRNPQTGEKIRIPKKRVVKFSAGKALKEKVND
jgi:DNA-binding protein HU-beta